MQIVAKKGAKLFRDFYIDMDIKPYSLPANIRLPIGFDNDKIELIKNIGDRVKKFEIIAYIKNKIPVYSSVSGKITDFSSSRLKGYTKNMQYAVIESDGEDLPSYPLWEIKSDYTKEEILEIIKKAKIKRLELHNELLKKKMEYEDQMEKDFQSFVKNLSTKW